VNRRLACSVTLVVLACSSCQTVEERAEPEEELLPGPVPGQTTIITVYDNYLVDPDLTTGWGFGCVVRTPEADILFDTGGDSSVLLSNMDKMGIQPEDIEIVVISHIHGDHVGGLGGFLERNGDVRVVIPASFPDEIRERIRASGAECEEARGPMQICDHVYSSGEMGTSIKEQSLVVCTGQGVVVVTGCAHPGVVNIARQAKQMLPQEEIYLVMGGFHLSGASEPQLRSIIAAFREMGIRQVAPSHCSGDLCRQLFALEYGGDYVEGGLGKTITL